MIQTFRIVGGLEAISFLLLLGVAMPLKYMYNEPMMVKIVGMAHGVLFMAYIALVFIIKDDANWKMKHVGLAILASVLPFGPFVVDRKLLQK